MRFLFTAATFFPAAALATAALALVAAICGCAVLDLVDEKVRFEVVPPELPRHLASVFGPVSFEYLVAGGSANSPSVAAAGGGPELEAPVGRFVIVLAQPVLAPRGGGAAGPGYLLPAGGIYPDGIDGSGRLPVSWGRGFAAEVLVEMALAGFQVGRFDCARFFKEVDVRSRGNPWGMDKEKIKRYLAGGGFRADLIDPLAAFPVLVTKVPGTWLSWNPLLGAVSAASGGYLSWERLAVGYHRFYRADGLSVLSIQVREDGTTFDTRSSLQ